MTTLRQLEYLVTVLELGSFTRAAEALHVTQPALSHQIRALERATGGPLVERLPRGVQPTPAGRAMLPSARAALADAERATCVARQVAGLEAGELRIATVHSLTLGYLPAALQLWHQDRPEVSIRLYEHQHTAALTQAMTAGQADLAVGPDPADWPGPVHPLGVEEFVILLPPGSGHTGPLHLGDLAAHPWVHYAPDHGLAEILDNACRQAGFEPKVAVRTEQTAAAPALAAAGLGAALVPRNILPPALDARAVHPDPPVERRLSAYTRREPDPLTAAFIDVLARLDPTPRRSGPHQPWTTSSAWSTS